MTIENEGYMQLTDEQDSVVSVIELSEAKAPRQGDWIALSDGATYEVERVVYHYGQRMGSGDMALLKITVAVKPVRS